ncbi:MAG: dihydrofolate reductase family protein [Anaerolineae bacterium]|jgi:dihydrofolate reductase|nr:dihydrofolate reductase family protein [Anaerolineae bacterium]
MGLARAGFTVSLDGFVADTDHGVSRIFKWYFAGDTPFPVGDHFTFKVAPASLPILDEMMTCFGAILTGRRDFDVSRAWGGQHPMNVPIFIVTHQPPAEWVGRPSPFTFVTDGVESALAKAQAAAGSKDVAVSGTTIVQQLLKAGLLDEIHLNVVPVLLGTGIRLFDALETPLDLQPTRIITGEGVTHLTYRIPR